MRLPDEPKGWRKLQKMAQQEDDPEKLASIIERMNRLLDEDEKRTGKKRADEGVSKNRNSCDSPQPSAQNLAI
jgi:hypothetical protein